MVEKVTIGNLPTLEKKDYNVMIDGRNSFDQPIKNDLIIYDNVRKISADQEDDYTTGCLLDYPYFKKIQQISCNRFKQTTKIRFWSKNNTAN